MSVVWKIQVSVLTEQEYERNKFGLVKTAFAFPYEVQCDCHNAVHGLDLITINTQPA